MAGDTADKAIPLGQVHHMAMGPSLSNTDKPRHSLARRGARKPRPADLNALGPDRALLHLFMKHTALHCGRPNRRCHHNPPQPDQLPDTGPYTNN